MSVISYIESAIQQKHEIFRNNYKEMIAAYKREKETTRGYNGRQLLELIQNCEDEGATEVLIRLDLDRHIIQISNNGNSFSKAGYDSLCIDSLSAKQNKKKFIGNKGLGFRSILNWAERLRIFSNNICLTYSSQDAKRTYFSLISSEKHEELIKEFGFKSDVIPFPILCSPNITTYEKSSGYMSTTIEIQYHAKFQHNIIAQINGLHSHDLLFLRNITQIRFEGIPTKDNIYCSKKHAQPGSGFGPSEFVQFETGEWEIFTNEGVVPIEQNDDMDIVGADFYQIKIAVPLQEEITSSQVYAFFPTQITIDFPCLLHATFDLDQSRNHINQSDKNSFLIDKIINMISSIALYKTKDKVEWTAYDLLQYENENEDLKRLGFYDKLEQNIAKLKIYPCLDNTYRLLQEARFISDNFSNQIATDNLSDLFPDMLIAGAENRDISARSDIENLTEKVSRLSLRIKTLSQRAQWIYLLHNDLHGEPFDILIDNKGAVIQIGKEIFTPATNGAIDIPEYCQLTILNEGLFIELLKIFKIDSDRKSRDLSQILKYYSLISYEPHPLAQRIISQTNDLIKSSPGEEFEVIIRGVRALYHNYSLNTEHSALQTRLLLPNQNGVFTPANLLILSSDYPSGKITAQIFERLYTSKDYLATRSKFGVDQCDEWSIQDFFIWLGVNQFVIKEQKTITSYIEPYAPFFRKIFPSNAGIKVELSIIDKLSAIFKVISIEGLITWTHYDNWLYKQLDNKTHDDKLQFFYYAWKTTKGESWIKYQVNKVFHIDSLLLDDRYRWANEYQINYEHPIFSANNITRKDIDNILIRLGAKTSLSELPEEHVGHILSTLPTQFPTGKNTQIIYSDILHYYQEKNAKIDYDVLLFASDGMGLQPYSQDKIFFSDRIQLPHKLKSHFPIFNFPIRSGGANAIKIYGINDLEKLSFTIQSEVYHELAQQSFDNFFTSITPLILAIRLNRVRAAEQRKREIAILNNIKFKFCSKLHYKVEAYSHELEDYEYLYVDSVYYVKVNTTDTLKVLLNRMAFCQAIAEILANAFDVPNAKPEFLLLLKEDTADTKEWVCHEYGGDFIAEASTALKGSNPKSKFISTIGRIKRSGPKDDGVILKGIGSAGSINFDNLSCSSNRPALQKLFSNLQITIDQFNFSSAEPLNFKAQLFWETRNYFRNFAHSVKCALWKYCDSTQPERLLDRIHEFSSGIDAFLESNIPNNLFEVDKADLFSRYLKDYGLEQTDDNWSEIESAQINRINQFSNEDQQIINSSKELKSRLYYNSDTDAIQQEINRIKDQAIENIQKLNLSSAMESELTILSNILSRPQQTSLPANSLQSSSTIWFPRYNQNNYQKQLGNHSETKVYTYMLKHPETFQSVEWASRENDGKHYDISYSSDKGLTFRYVEVKTFAGSYFELTAAEWEFGQAHKENYEIWLVSDNKIYIINDLFVNDINYEIHPCKYRISVSAGDYQITDK